MADTGKTIGLIKALASVDPEAIKSSVDDWLDDHPEATTTVEDGAITKAKLDSSLQQTVDDVGDLKSAIWSAFATDTASGSIASFTDGADNIPFKTLTAAIEPKQGGTGWDEVNVTRLGFNQWDEECELGTISTSDGEEADSSNSIRAKNFIRVLPGATYYIKSSDNLFINFYDSDKGFIQYYGSTISNTTLTIPDGAYYIRIWFKVAYGTAYKHDTCISFSGTRNGEYEAYHGNTLSVNLVTVTGGAVSSGTLTVNSDGSGVVSVNGAGSYEFTTNQLTTLLGTNYVWCDAGEVTAEYRADATLYIDKKMAELQALVLENINS